MNNKFFYAKSLAILMASVLLFASCATLFTGTRDTIHFNSDPSGAMVFIDGVEQCKTPCTLSVKRDMNYTDVEFRLDGYQTRIITLSREFNTVSILNLGNLMGWAIDALSGAIFRYDRKSYDISLTEDIRNAMTNPIRINIDTKNNLVEVFVVEK